MLSQHRALSTRLPRFILWTYWQLLQVLVHGRASPPDAFFALEHKLEKDVLVFAETLGSLETVDAFVRGFIGVLWEGRVRMLALLGCEWMSGRPYSAEDCVDGRILPPIAAALAV